MRGLAFSIFLIGCGVVLCAAAKDETVEQLKSRFESARPEDQPRLAIQVARHQLRNADKLYHDGRVEDAREAVGDVVSYCEKARDAAKETRKHLKNVEIGVRQIADRLRDLKRTLAFEDQSPVEQAIRRLEDIRTELLKEMFAKEPKKEKK